MKLETIKISAKRYSSKLLHQSLLDSFKNNQQALIYHNDKGAWVSKPNKQFIGLVQVLAAHLIKNGLKKGDRVLIAGFSTWQWLASELAVLQSGGVVVGVDPFIESGQFSAIKEQTNATFLITNSTETSNKWKNQLDNIKVISWSEKEEYLYKGAGSEIPKAASVNIFNDDVATIIYTSGTTGKPKGISYTHEQIYLAVETIHTHLPEITYAKERYVSWLPLAHLFQRMLNYFAMVHGGELFFLDDPRKISSALPEIKPSVMIGVPKFFQKFRDGIQEKIQQSNSVVRTLFKNAMRTSETIVRLKRSDEPISKSLILKNKIYDKLITNKIRESFGGNIKLWISGSAPLSDGVLAFFDAIGYPIFEAYGVSENIIPNTMNSFGDYRPLSVGKPMSHQEILISGDGEILIKGPGVLKHYLNASESAVSEDGFYHTGDLGYFDEDGFLYIKGRKGDFIKLSNGHKVYPANIESRLNNSQAIEQSFVHGTGSGELVALIYPTEVNLELKKQRVRLQAAIDQVNRSIDRHEVVRDFHIMTEPFSMTSNELTASLKLRRRQIEQNYVTILNEL